MLPESTSAENPTLPLQVPLSSLCLSARPWTQLFPELSVQLEFIVHFSYPTKPGSASHCSTLSCYSTVSHICLPLPSDCKGSLIQPCFITALSTDLPGSRACSVLASRESSQDVAYDIFCSQDQHAGYMLSDNHPSVAQLKD